MTTENSQNNANTAGTSTDKKPDFIAMQYRVVRVEDGWKTRKERIGVAWHNDKGGFSFRPTGKQIIEGDVHFFPADQNQ